MHVYLFQQSSKSDDVKSSDPAKDSSNHFWNPLFEFAVSFLLISMHLFYKQVQAKPNSALTHSLTLSLPVSLSIAVALI